MSELNPIDPPPNCQEIPGYILVVEIGKKWITKDGLVTEDFAERGIWATPEDADRALDKFFMNRKVDVE